MAFLARTIGPFTERRSPRSPSLASLLGRNVFVGVEKGYATACFGEQEEELRDPRCARNWLIWKSHGIRPVFSVLTCHLNRLDLSPAGHMARSTRPAHSHRAPPNWHVTGSPPGFQTTDLTSEPSRFRRFGVARRHSRGRLEGHHKEAGQGQ